MSAGRFDAILILGCILAGAGIFLTSAQGMLHVSGKVSDGLLALLALVIAYRLWRLWSRKHG
jgi:hypothetical protein